MEDARQFFSLNKRKDWQKGQAYNVQVTDAGVAVQQTEKYGVYRLIRPEDLPGVPAVTDLAVAHGEKIYLLDEEANIWMYDYENRHREPLFASGHELFTGKATMAAQSGLLFIAETEGRIKLAAYSTSNGQMMWEASEWNGSELYPLAIDTSGDGQWELHAAVPLDITVGLSGKPQVPKGGRIAVLHWIAGQVAHVYEDESLDLDEDTPVSELEERFFIAVAAKGTLGVFDRKRKRVTVFREEGSVIAHFEVELPGSFAGISIDTNHNFYIGNSGLVQHDSSGERFILKYRATGELLERIHGFRGRSDKLVHDTRDRLYVLDRQSGQISLLDLQTRTMLQDNSGLPEGIYFSGELDSTESEMIWHKIRLEADIPDETQIRISYFASDWTDGYIGEDYVNYTQYLTSPDIPLANKILATQDLFAKHPTIVNPRDALLDAKGRYLWFRLELVGSEVRTPMLRKLRVYFPRTSPISYLPPIYQQDDEHSPFLERFLAMFGTFFDDMEEQIDRVSKFFDADAVSGPYLKWLGRWLAISDADAWGEAKLRELIKQAPLLYRLRGTRDGLIRMLQLYTGEKPFLLEYFQFKRMQETSELRDLFAHLYGDNPYVFCVMVSPDAVRTDKQRLIIEQIIEDQKPAYTEGKLFVLQPRIYADMHTYLEVNTYLSEPTFLRLDQRSSLPYNTLLTDVDRDNRMDLHTRLELDSELE